MDAYEMALKEQIQHEGWWTKSENTQTVENGPEVDIIAYNPSTGKMLYGNLTHLSHESDESKLIR